MSAPDRAAVARSLPGAAPVPAAASGMSPAFVVLVLGLLLGIQPITTDLYLPALPALTASFGASMGQAQLTFSALLLAFGLSQLVWGPLSDRFGRKPVLLAGLALHTLASVAAALAPSMDLLIAARVMQGAAIGAAVMCARALVRDLYAPDIGARVMSRGLTGVGILACLGPLLGGVLSQWLGWRVALMAVAVFGAATLALVAARFEETLGRANPQALRPATLLSTWATIAGNRTFLAWCLLAACGYGGLSTFLASSSFVFIDIFGLSRTAYGLVLFGASFCYIGGTLACRRMLPRLGVRRSVALAGAFSLTAGVLLVLLAAAGVHSPWAIALPLVFFMVAHGVNQPCSLSGTVSAFPQAAGAASALAGFVMMAVAFVTGLWLGRRMDGTVMPLVEGIAFWSAGLALTAWTLVQRHGEPQRG